ncbi:MAG: DUF1059 domain-containing protein [Candidatus Woesearchaeota archaeon]|nr:DUF1059 domain-containing protein [Candidatus Woesearchaeota archaeon]
MKTMTCTQLGGACETEFHAETFEEMAAMSKNHGMEMREDPAHQEAMQKMMELMQDSDAMAKWFAERQEAFEALPEDS